MISFPLHVQFCKCVCSITLSILLFISPLSPFSFQFTLWLLLQGSHSALRCSSHMSVHVLPSFQPTYCHLFYPLSSPPVSFHLSLCMPSRNQPHPVAPKETLLLDHHGSWYPFLCLYWFNLCQRKILPSVCQICYLPSSSCLYSHMTIKFVAGLLSSKAESTIWTIVDHISM